ncbi:hypothetical protein [Roseburia sp. 499]|uniref:hypothetical protein n=1 Tax=Roseburia sp. 499 TaxID=1261634 RepID=UPI00095352E7|nr:hypothetical protein [Roseburia sp. 499]WVK70854.1 hypothetical protein BIV20_04790 [Roseburia sp. 499]
MSTQVKVNLSELEKIEGKLLSLQKRMTNRKVSVNFVNTKGSVADEMVNAASKLNEIGTTLTTLITKTGKVVENAKVSFEAVDAEISRLFESGDE